MEKKDQLIQAYKELTLENKKFPLSILVLCAKAGIERGEFSQYFQNLTALENAIWQSWFMDTIRSIEAADEYEEYTVREKMLAFYYTFLEVLRPEKEFLFYYGDQFGIWNYNPRCLKELKPLFLAFVTELMLEGKEVGELAERYVIGGDYAGWHWPQFLYLLNFNLRDKSENCEKTDQAIEKAVNLGFDFMARNVFDSAFEFGRFLFTS